jgi:hypothetical protein
MDKVEADTASVQPPVAAGVSQAVWTALAAQLGQTMRERHSAATRRGIRAARDRRQQQQQSK